jgi:hypothetical protein
LINKSKIHKWVIQIYIILIVLGVLNKVIFFDYEFFDLFKKKIYKTSFEIFKYVNNSK